MIVDGRRVLSCLTLTATCQGKSVTTVEGLARNEELHPMQTAFIAVNRAVGTVSAHADNVARPHKSALVLRG